MTDTFILKPAGGTPTINKITSVKYKNIEICIQLLFPNNSAQLNTYLVKILLKMPSCYPMIHKQNDYDMLRLKDLSDN